MDRRDFLKQTGFGALAATGAKAAAPAVSLAVARDAVTASAPVEWALGELRARVNVREGTPLRIEVAGRAGGAAQSFALRPAAGGVSVTAPDAAGMVYALLELAGRAGQEKFGITAPVVESPANRVRSVARFFVSDVEDKPWYNDRDFWRAYLTSLAANRFNRFNLTFGIGYDFARQIRDCYFHFPYPFLMDVKGYKVRARGLPDEERDSNFAMLKFIAKETVARGLEFHLALWTHAYVWEASPNANYVIDGLTPETQAPYCRDALTRILAEVPEISGLTFRVHGESGVPEGSYDFWKTLFLAAKGSGRRISLDLHAKGIDRTMIDTALSTGLPVSVSPKFMAEHMGLPYQQAGIRELEMPPKEQRTGFFALSSGARSFMRYSYGDLFDEQRRYGVMFRIWPGTQRLLLWGDPEFAAAYGKAFQFCGATGVEWCEPLSFKGRKGGGLPGGRTGYADASLAPKYDFEKYEYTYRVFGRGLYNPATVPAAATPAEKALASASRILPLITSAHGASAANNNYWPEMYWNMSLVDPKAKHPYGDSPQPRVFGTVSPFDPEMFASVVEYVEGKSGVKYTPLEVAEWLERLADAALAGEAPRASAIDIRITAGIGQFFAAKFRAAVAYQQGDVDGAIAQYRKAREAWARLANTAKGVYRPDVTFGYDYQLRGHWLDRLAGIDEDIARLEKLSARPPRVTPPAGHRAAWQCRHTPPAGFRAGAPVQVTLTVAGASPVLRYRHVNQVERFAAMPMTGADGSFQATIPGEFTKSPYPLQYYFELRGGDGFGMYPGLGERLADQPYFVIRQA
ncbi:MAG: hypothetical protein JST11_25280 [Acidobacteria bacterium]|nr:hypothetical protein [Acidobacteriota bacterium]